MDLFGKSHNAPSGGHLATILVWYSEAQVSPSAVHCGIFRKGPLRICVIRFMHMRNSINGYALLITHMNNSIYGYALLITHMRNSIYGYALIITHMHNFINGYA